MENNWLIYSFEHNAFWRPDSCGYTNFIDAAGRYTEQEAEDICVDARTGRGSDESLNPPEIMMRECDVIRNWRTNRNLSKNNK